MVNIKVLSRHAFSSFLKEHNINDQTVSSLVNTYLISINTTYGNDSKHFFEYNHDNVLTLDFDDVDKDGEFIDLSNIKETIKTKAMTEAQGEEIYNFVKKISDGSTVIVHCTLGKCRSGAVGAFINDYFEQKWSDFIKQNPQVQPNSHISSTLRKYL